MVGCEIVMLVMSISMLAAPFRDRVKQTLVSDFRVKLQDQQISFSVFPVALDQFIK